MLDTSSRSGVWLDRFGPDTYNHGQYFTPLTRRCRHAAASVGGCIYVYGGIGGSGESNSEFLRLLVNLIFTKFADFIFFELKVAIFFLQLH